MHLLIYWPSQPARGPVAQLVEHRPFKAGVLGSNPSRLTTKIRFIIQDQIYRVSSKERKTFLVLNFECSSRICPHRLARPRTPPFHGDNGGSNPPGDAKKSADT